MGAQPQPWQIFPQSIVGGCSGLLILRVRFDSLWGNLKYNGYITAGVCKTSLLYQIAILDFGVGEFKSLCAHQKALRGLIRELRPPPTDSSNGRKTFKAVELQSFSTNGYWAGLVTLRRTENP